MKDAILKTVVIVIAGIHLLSVSCKKSEPIVTGINDFKSVKSEFSTPSAEFTTAPFFVWNYKMTKNDIDRYLNDFREKGSLQVFVHPRPGLITEYLSDEWFDLFRYTVERGKELGMKVWIYDENSYPSGFAGGHVPEQMPESYNQGQGLRMTKADILPDTAEKYFMCLKEDEGRFMDITAGIESEKGKTGKYFLFSKTYNARSDWYAGFPYVDLLYPGVTQKFIGITMTGYEKYAGHEFGKTIPGTFTDEPQIKSPGGIRWTPDLFDVFRQKWGYDLKTQLPSLFEETGDWKKVRHNYVQTLLQLFIDRWAKPWYDYCESKNLKFTGHYWEHEWPSMRSGGDNMAMYAWHQVPAIDMLFNQWNDSTPGAQFGNVRSVKELSSAANQTGRQRKLSETYGGGGWELSFADMKRLGDWEYAMGVNLMNQHISPVSIAGARKYDYPLTFTYHEPWWQDYKYINDHYARLSMALSAGRQVNDILVIEPSTSAWLYDSYSKPDPRYAEIGQSFQTFITTLEKNQVEYDLGSENIIKDRGSVSHGKFIVGQCEYSTVVLPPMMENLDLPTFKLIQRFVASGGKLIAFSKPSLINGSENRLPGEFFEKYKGKITSESELSEAVISKYFSGSDIKFSRFTYGDLYHHRRILADGQILFLVNSSLTGQVSGSLTAKGAAAYELNTFEGTVNGYKWSNEEDRVAIEFSLPPAGSLLLFIPGIYDERHITPYQPRELNPVLTDKQMTISKERENVLPLEFCDLTLGGETTADLHNYTATDKVFKYYGFPNGNPWNHSVQFRSEIIERDTFGVNTGFTAAYHFTVRGTFDRSSMKAVVERPSLWSISVNGTEVKPEEGKWWLDREFSVCNIGDLVQPGDNTVTLTASPMTVHAEIEPVYITGNFSVKPADKGWTLEAPASVMKTGSWKEQGMPFYSWGVTYTREFTVENPEGYFQVALGDWKGTIAEVTVNDSPKKIIAFPPYMCDVTDLIRPGVNKVDVRLIGSLKSLMGPHFNNPAPGLVSPGNFRNVNAYPAGAGYQLPDYGLMQDFQLLNGK